MHGASLNEVTSITAEVYDTRSLSPVRTPVGVTKVHHNFASFFPESEKDTEHCTNKNIMPKVQGNPTSTLAKTSMTESH
jgi:hypothetical protein